MSELVADRAEHRAALTAALEHGDPHYVLELSGALYWFWYRKANVSEGLGFLRAAIERVDQHPIAPKPENLGRALMGMALLTDLTGDSETAQRHSDRAARYCSKPATLRTSPMRTHWGPTTAPCAVITTAQWISCSEVSSMHAASESTGSKPPF